MYGLSIVLDVTWFISLMGKPEKRLYLNGIKEFESVILSIRNFSSL